MVGGCFPGGKQFAFQKPRLALGGKLTIECRHKYPGFQFREIDKGGLDLLGALTKEPEV